MAQVASPVLSAASSQSNALPAEADLTARSDEARGAPEAEHPLTAEDLSIFFDGLVPYALKRGDVAGGVISVVKDGKVLFARGYGYADLETRQAPSPQTTLFRPGSTSKLFTWTAVM
ncbi:MAG: serine hydrolase, partial [Rhodanobacter sp.]